MKLPKNPNNPWSTKDKTLVYENPWISVEDHVALNPNGSESQYGVVRFKNLAVGVIPIDENGNTYLVGQHRYPLDEYSWEIPEGGSLLSADPLESAKRELKEETGLIAQQWTQIMDIRLSNSVTDEKGIIFVASELALGDSEPEPTENITVCKLPFKEVVQYVMQGRITDIITIAAVLKLEKMITTGDLAINV